MIAQSLADISAIPCFDANPRGRLLLAAAYLFHQQGYEKTTVREIAQLIGIRSGSLFHHFKSKEEILAAVMQATILYNAARLNQAAALSTVAEQQLRHLIHAELTSITGDTGAAMAVLVFEWQALSLDKQTELLQQREDYEQVWLGVLEQLHQQGKIKHDPFILRRLITGALAWTVNWYTANGETNVEQLTDIVLDMVI